VIEALEPINERAEYDGKYNPARPVTSAFNVLIHELAWQSTSDRHGTHLEIMGAELARSYDAAGRHNHITADNPYRVWQLYTLIGSVAAYTDDQREAVREWFDQTPEEAALYNSDQVEAQYCHMSAQAFERLYNRETEPHRVPVSEFARLLAEHSPESTMFDRDTMRYYHQTRKDITVEAFYLVEDCKGNTRDCYRVESSQMTDYDERRHTVVYYFDRKSFDLVKLVDPEK
jgi:hypothetical protein